MNATVLRKPLQCKDRIASVYGGRMPEDKVEELTGMLLQIKRNRGMTIEELATACRMDYSHASQMTGLLEADGLITVDLLQRCCINIR